jgi:hypothetical protein
VSRALGALLLLALVRLAVAGEPVRLILDTDIASDCDDAGAVALLHGLAGSGEVEILAMMVCTGGPHGAPALAAINRWYGRDGIPIGAVRAPRFWVGGGPDLPAGAANYESYNRTLAETCPHGLGAGPVPDATALYRSILAAQPDGTVVVCTIGPLINLARLLDSGADAASPLAGPELVRRKVRLAVITGGRNPAGTSSNFSKEDAELYAAPVIARWPTRMVFCGNEVGGTVDTGWRSRREATAGNPARLAYRRFFAGDDTRERPSWDQAGVLFAVRGTGDVFTLHETGVQTCAADGTTAWAEAEDPARDHAYVVKREGVDGRLKIEFEELMTRPP